MTITGCASPSYNYVPITKEISFPNIGQIVTKQLGEDLLVQGLFAEEDALYVPEAICMGMLCGYEIMPGYFKKSGESKEAHTFFSNHAMSSTMAMTGVTEFGRIDKAALADPDKAIMIYKNKPKRICAVSIFNAEACEDNQEFELRKVNSANTRAFQQTLIYTGRIGSKLNISYRETSNSLARPAFGTSVEYDLNTSNIIGYRGAKLEILDATNETITYKVISNFNKTSM